MKSWTEEEIKILKENYNTVSNEKLCELIPNKTKSAIYKKAYKTGFRKAKDITFLNRSIANKGNKCNFWKGGTATTTQGYKRVKMPEHHRADNKGYVFEHILIFEKETGIKVPDNCCIHHLNGIKDDNNIQNLCMMTHSAHTIFHNKTRERKKKNDK